MAKDLSKYCEVCGTGFYGERNSSQYCSPRCRTRAYRTRQKESVQEALDNAQKDYFKELMRPKPIPIILHSEKPSVEVEAEEELISKKNLENGLEEISDLDKAPRLKKKHQDRLNEIKNRKADSKVSPISLIGLGLMAALNVAGAVQRNKTQISPTTNGPQTGIDKNLPLQKPENPDESQPDTA